MNQDEQARELINSLFARARSLAHEHLSNAQNARSRIVSEANDRLRLKEEREILSAKALAERTFQRRVQAAEVRLQGEIDRLRWTLVQGVVGEARARFIAFAAEDGPYREWVSRRMREAAARLPEGRLVARMNAEDRARIAHAWGSVVDAAPGRTVALSPESLGVAAGFMLYTEDGRIRVDETLEGRLERLEAELHRTVMQHLFASVPDMGALFHG